jgi:hypothetical protein
MKHMTWETMPWWQKTGLFLAFYSWELFKTWLTVMLIALALAAGGTTVPF